MRAYFKFRFLVMAALIGVILLVAHTGMAQSGGAAPPADEGPKHAVGPVGLLVRQMMKGDMVGWTVVVLSIIGMTFIIQGFIKTRSTVMMPESSTAHIEELIAAKQFKELIEFTESDPSFISKAMNQSLKRAPSFPAMKEAMETSIGEQTAEAFRKIEFLNIIGNLGPLLGLLGTVMGMVESFGQMEAAKGQADPKVLSGGIAMALAHTFAGLVLALPCLAAFGILRTMTDRLTVRGALVAEELLLKVKPAEAKPAAAATNMARPAVATPKPAVPAIPAAAPRKPAAPAPAAQ